MRMTTAQIEKSRRAPLGGEAPTAQQWVCCVAAAVINPWSWQMQLYIFAQQQAHLSLKPAAQDSWPWN